MLGRVANGLIAAGFAGTVLAPAQGLYYIVEPGERAIIFNKFSGGIGDYVIGEGFHFKIPFAQDVIKYDVRLKPFEYPTSTGTKDLQQVKLHLRILYRPVEEVIPKIHLTYDKDYAQRLLPSIGNEVLKSVIAQFDADQLLKNRETVSCLIKDNISTRAREYMIVEDVSLIDLKFSSEYVKSIEAKQSAQQEAERYKFIVQQDEQFKAAAIIQAEGKAEAAKLISESVAKYGNSVIELKKIEAAQEITKNLTSSPNISFVPSNVNMLLGMPGMGV